MIIDPKTLNGQDSSHLLTDIVVPRPIAWVSTVDDHGIYNLAPFSAYCMVSTSPVIVGLGVGTKRHGEKKDTARNIEANKEFVVAMVTEELGDAMNITCAAYPPEVSEFPRAGMTPVKANIVKPALVAESPINLECRMVQNLKFGKAGAEHNFFLGEVLLVHIKDEFWDKESRRVKELRSIARLGGDHDLYCRTRDTFRIPRPTGLP
jgi:flavin reductase (DIM6/NTAB) family NADH-FMN oxidoreductase RutF